MTRIHGDFHLGQALVGHGGVSIIDEAASRPAWLAVPPAGLLLLARRVLSGPEERP